MTQKITIGTRGSDLALWQANYTRNLLEKCGVQVEIRIIKTKGDQIQTLSFQKMEGKGFFTKELEDALLSREIDLAVHSHKDLPTEQPQGLCIAGVSYREDCSETILIRQGANDPSLPLSIRKGAITGTSSLRRKSQLLQIRPDLNLHDLRGNLPTRIEKLRRGEYDAIVLATAGLNRLGLDLDDLTCIPLPAHVFIPAPAQGVLAYQTRSDDQSTIAAIQAISNQEVSYQIQAERSVLNKLDGGCQLPLGVYCQMKEDGLALWASLQPLNGEPFRRIFIRAGNPESLTEKALHALTRKQEKSVYISRNPEDAPLFTKQVGNYGYKVQAISPLQFETIEISHLPFSDWIFFTSPRSVHHFFSQEMLCPATTQIAALGSGTASALTQIGMKAHFIGNDGETRETARAFLELGKGCDIVFPCAESGLRNVQKELELHAKVIDVPVYRTLPATLPGIQADMFVFTSPSAFESYVQQLGLPLGQLFAIGSSTLEAIRNKGLDAAVAAHTTEQSLADLVCGW